MNERLKELRKDRLKISQTEFGKKIGITGTQVLYLEKGVRNITERMLLAICRTYKVREEWLRHGIGPMEEQEPKDEIERIAKANGWGVWLQEALKLYSELTEAEKAMVQKFADELAGNVRGKRSSADIVIEETAELTAEAEPDEPAIDITLSKLADGRAELEAGAELTAGIGEAEEYINIYRCLKAARRRVPGCR
jgi:transcriptional regulator with XRE-family HTH domain